MRKNIHYLRKLGFTKLPSLNVFIKLQHHKLSKDVDEYKLYEAVRKYAKDLEAIPERSDFIAFDSKGDPIENHVPIFKGWEMCPEASDGKNIVAKLVGKNNEYRIYFNTADGVVIMSHTHTSDKVKYNELAIFFESNLLLN